MKERVMDLKLAMATVVIGLSLSGVLQAQAQENPMVEMITTAGAITLELYPDKAPATVANFLAYVDDGFFKDTVFHRVIPNFMIQGGGFDARFSRKPTREAIVNEAANGLRNDRGTLAMARTAVPNSATAQFFINTVNNNSLNFRDASDAGIGYCVFGRVTDGMDVVDAIQSAPTGMRAGMRDVPLEDIVIKDVLRLASETAETTAPEAR